MSRFIKCHSKHILIILILILLSPQKGSGQTNGAWIGAGIQTSTMENMKYMQEYILESYPVEGKIISSFPAYTMTSFGWVHQWYPMVRINAGYAFATTGAKSNYTDYSGYITTLMKAVSHRAVVSAYFSLMNLDWFEISAFGRIDVKYSRIDITSNLYSFGASGATENSYSSWSPGLGGGAEMLVHLEKYSFGVEGGYEFDIQGKLTNINSKTELADPNDPDRILTSDWTGWFAQAKFILWFDF